MTKQRLDHLLLDRGIFGTLNEAQAHIFRGNVLVDEKKIMKPGTLVDPTLPIRTLHAVSQYVSRGGDKLAGAWETFQFPIRDRTALDIGISTGGFTDFLRQHDARYIVGVDVGYGQVHHRLQDADNVVILERTNARHLTSQRVQQALHAHPSPLVIAPFTLVVMDVSFISVTTLLPIIQPLVSPETDYIILIKPQFEAEKHHIPKGGVIQDDTVIDTLLASVRQTLSHHGFTVKHMAPSPIRGAKGNLEFFFWLRHA